MTRLEGNREILKRLSDYFEKNPDIRFIQGLWNNGIITRNSNFQIVDRFYEEPEKTLEIMEQM